MGHKGNALFIIASDPAIGKRSAVGVTRGKHVATDSEQRERQCAGANDGCKFKFIYMLDARSPLDLWTWDHAVCSAGIERGTKRRSAMPR